MSALRDGGIAQRFAAVRVRILAALLARALLLAAAAGLATVALLVLFDLLLGLPPQLRSSLRTAPWLAAAVTALLLGRRAITTVHAANNEHIALWFEQRLPSLQYALVTRATAAIPADAASARALDAQIAAAPLDATLSRALLQSLRAPALAAAVGLLLLLALPSGAVARIAVPRAGDSLERPAAIAAAAANPLATIVAVVEPPAYTGLSAVTVDDPAALRGLVGSRVRIRGRGREVQAALGADPPRAAVQTDDAWSITLPMPPRAMPVRLSASGGERVLLLDPIADSVPELRLELPARDTVMREARGRLALAAALRDDHGLAEASFEFIVSSGDGELFEFRTLRVGRQAYGAGSKTARLEASVSLDSLRLTPGDLVHLRAVAVDRNDVTGPGRGASETRTLRVARADEYDSVAVDPAPPSEPEKDALSQRMILQQTRELVARSRRIGPEQTSRESRRIAVDQTKLRQRVGRVVFERLGENEGEHQHFPGDGHAHGEERPLNPDDILAAAERAANADASRNLDTHGEETPIVAINRPLLEAYNHMWRASSELELGEPAAAIPWMERAIAALQAARAAERIYLRGRPPAVVVDLARVRLAGKDEGAPTARRPRTNADAAQSARLARFDALLAVVAEDPAAAADSLLLLRVSLPEEARQAAQALDAAANALRQGGDVTLPLANARRALVTEPPRRESLGPWGM